LARVFPANLPQRGNANANANGIASQRGMRHAAFESCPSLNPFACHIRRGQTPNGSREQRQPTKKQRKACHKQISQRLWGNVAAAVAATTRSANNKISNKAESKLARGENNTTREMKSEQIRTRW